MAQTNFRVFQAGSGPNRAVPASESVTSRTAAVRPHAARGILSESSPTAACQWLSGRRPDPPATRGGHDTRKHARRLGGRENRCKDSDATARAVARTLAGHRVAA